MGTSYQVELIVDRALYNFTPPGRRVSWALRSLGIHSYVPIWFDPFPGISHSVDHFPVAVGWTCAEPIRYRRSAL